jgi:hypothetical protein
MGPGRNMSLPCRWKEVLNRQHSSRIQPVLPLPTLCAFAVRAIARASM